MNKVIKRTAISFLTIVLVGKFLLWFSQLAFAEKYEYKNFTIYSTRAIKADYTSFETVFESVAGKIKRCENWEANREHDIFLCEPGAFYHMFMFTENDSYAYNSTFRHNILVFPIADFENNTVTRPGSDISYFLDQLLAHEIAHTFVTDDLPFWKMEGYAEYISHYKENYVQSGDFRKNALTLLTSNTGTLRTQLLGKPT